MIKQIIYRFLQRRHFWRYASFDQLGELYTSMLLRSMGLNLVGIFLPIYLYLEGFELVQVMFFMVMVFAMRIFFDVLGGFAVAAYGPKHVILISNVLQLIALGMLLMINDFNLPLWLLALAWAPALSFFWVAYHVDFSKIIHYEHGGKELGIMTIIERGGGVLGPLVGGLVAAMYGADKTIIVAIVLFIISSAPLLMSPEPTKLNQKIMFKGLNPRRFWRDYVGFFGIGHDTQTSNGLWPLYAGVFVFAANEYAGIGMVTSIGILAAIVSAKAIGSLIDRKHGRLLLRWSVLLKAITNLFRPFANIPVAAAMVNIAQETSSTGTRLPFTQGMYDRSDSLPGYRIAYLIILEIFGDLGKAFVWLVPAVLCLYIDPFWAIITGFVVGAAVSSLVALEKFPALNPRRIL